ncbi:hypothetical protein BDY19DRAFT_1060168 [Irpex rosettiformis]|uniref:Uncharacterized protein n=1 Tax=Irpex rosettiformis TaxID=378272 RepID=A0ACB8TS12_9APHY|nr:hypothetical protein BDY19DRAFT_1060168 [Irpex rosettiformis]
MSSGSSHNTYYYVLGTHSPSRSVSVNPEITVFDLACLVHADCPSLPANTTLEVYKAEKEWFEKEPTTLDAFVAELRKAGKLLYLAPCETVQSFFSGATRFHVIVRVVALPVVTTIPVADGGPVSNKRPRTLDPREIVAFVARKRHLPSRAAEQIEITKTQSTSQEDAVYNGRPIQLLQPPVAVWHPLFAKFRRLMSMSPETLKFSPSQLDRAREFMVVSAKFYPSDSARAYELCRNPPLVLPECFKEISIPGRIVETDGGATVRSSSSSGEILEAFPLFMEVRSEIGLGHTDPLIRAQCGYKTIYCSEKYTPIRRRSCCPAFLVAVAGPWISVSGAVFADRIICEHLVDFMSLSPDFSSSTRGRLDAGIRKAAQLMSALEECITELDEYYQNLFLARNEDNQLSYSQDQHHPWAPHFRQFTTGDRGCVTLDYVDRLSKENTEQALFKAIARDKAGWHSNVVVKFTPTYNREAHMRLADADLAPKLLFCERVDDVGGWYVVVMDYVEALEEVETLCRYPGAVQRLREAVKLLHEDGLVFGDLRKPNVLVTEDGESVMLVDFDWCGKEGEGRYPSDIDLDGYTISWHSDVERGGEMKKEHDRWMFEVLTAEAL